MEPTKDGNPRTTTFPQDDDENLDDLDDVLDQFSNAPTPSKPPPAQSPPSASKGKQKSPHPAVVPAPPPPPTDAIDDDDFAKELAAGMEQLMRELGVPTTQTEKDEAEFKKAWEKMLVGELNGSGEGGGGGIDDETLDGIFGLKDLGGAGAGAGAGGAAKGKEKVAEDEFQKKIKQAMEKLKDSDDSAKADASTSTDPLAQLLSSLGDLNLDEEGEEGEGGIHNMLEGMMAQLMSKDILYDPLKELNSKFPEYLSTNAKTLPPADLERYKTQQSLVAQIIKAFEDPNYSEDDPKKAGEVLKLMNEMQSYGSPPAEIMGPLPPGMDVGPDGMPKFPTDADGCIIC